MRRRWLSAVAAAAATLLVVSAAPRADAAGPFPLPDLTPPVITVDAPASPWEGWYADTIDLTVTLTDPGSNASGVLTGSWTMNGATTDEGQLPRTGSKTLTISAHGLTTVVLRASDQNGNQAERSYGVGIDRANPTFVVTPHLADNPAFVQDAAVPVTYTCTDEGTQVASCLGSVTSGSDLPTSVLGNHVFTMEVRDRVGNTTRQSFPYRVVARTLSVVNAPVFDGYPEVGSVLGTSVLTTSPAADSVTYHWMRDGVIVSDTHSGEYRLTNADVGARITLRVTARRAGYADLTVDASGSVGPVRLQSLVAVTPPVIAGTKRVGSTLTSSIPTFAPAATSVGYQWLRDGRPITGATSRTRKLSTSDLGHRLSMRATGVRAGYSPTERESGATTVIAKAKSSVSISTTALGGRKVRVTVRVRATGLTPTGIVTIKRSSRSVKHVTLRNGTATVTLTSQPRGKRTFYAAYRGSSWVLAGTSRGSVVTVR